MHISGYGTVSLRFRVFGCRLDNERKITFIFVCIVSVSSNLFYCRGNRTLEMAKFEQLHGVPLPPLRL